LAQIFSVIATRANNDITYGRKGIHLPLHLFLPYNMVEKGEVANDRQDGPYLSLRLALGRS